MFCLDDMLFTMHCRLAGYAAYHSRDAAGGLGLFYKNAVLWSRVLFLWLVQ